MSKDRSEVPSDAAPLEAVPNPLNRSTPPSEPQYTKLSPEARQRVVSVVEQQWRAGLLDTKEKPEESSTSEAPSPTDINEMYDREDKKTLDYLEQETEKLRQAGLLPSQQSATTPK